MTAGEKSIIKSIKNIVDLNWSPVPSKSLTNPFRDFNYFTGFWIVPVSKKHLLTPFERKYFSFEISNLILLKF